ncbi:MAG: hypothetical protein AMJ69_06165 [Gammaproteobacteria bacterium SG8_47]|nr:MAG: hypothetical protein AMJ69_06165 [Gammaproteobacteria bacterium SG8_47]
MRKSSFLATAVLLALAGLGAGLIFDHWWNKPTSDAEPTTPQAAKPPGRRAEFTLTDLDGNPRNISEWDGKVIVLNFWATWCPPCRREMPAFIQLFDNYHDQGLVVLGVAIDAVEGVRDFVDPMGINYPVLVGETDAIDAAKAYGNRLGVLPYTAIIDRSGQVVATEARELSYAEVESLVKPLL